MAALFIFVNRLPFLAVTLDNVDPLFVLLIRIAFYLHNVEVADKIPANDSP